METYYYLLHQCQARLSEVDIGFVDFISPGATLLGAAIGAGLSGYYAYKSSVRAGRDLIKHNKLEEAYGELRELDGYPINQMRKVIEELDNGRPHEAYELSERHELNLIGLSRLKALTIIDLYFDEGEQHVDRLRKAVSDFRQVVQMLVSTSKSDNEVLGKMLREDLLAVDEAQQKLITLLKEHLTK